MDRPEGTGVFLGVLIGALLWWFITLLMAWLISHI